MKIKVSELKDAKLDYWVGVSNGLMVEVKNGVCFRETSFGKHEYSPSTNWLEGGPIIEREKISILPRIDGSWYAEVPMEIKQDGVFAVGATPLIAAMRCYVSSKFGEEVEEA